MKTPMPVTPEDTNAIMALNAFCKGLGLLHRTKAQFFSAALLNLSEPRALDAHGRPVWYDASVSGTRGR